MARNPYQNRMMQPEQVDTGDVPYIDYNSQNINPMMMQAAAQAQQRYDLSQTAIAKAIEENASGEYRDVDYTNTVSALDRAMQDVNKTVKDKYDNQYGNALPEILKGIAKSRGILNNAQKEYKESQKYEAMMNQLEMQGKLILPGGRDPRKQASIDANGKYTPVDYSGFKEQSDYDATIQKAVVDGIDKNVIDSGLVSANVAGMLKSVKTQGLAALGKTPEEIDKALEQAAAEYAPIFENETTFNDDVNLQKKTGGMSSKDYVKSTIYRLAKNVTDNQYMANPNYESPSSKRTTYDETPWSNIMSPRGNEKIRANELYNKIPSFTSILAVPGIQFTEEGQNFKTIDESIAAQEAALKFTEESDKKDANVNKLLAMKDELLGKYGKAALMLIDPMGEIGSKGIQGITKLSMNERKEREERLNQTKHLKNSGKFDEYKQALQDAGIDTKGKSELQVLQLMDQNEEALSQVTGESSIIQDPEVNTNFKRFLSNRIEAIDFKDKDGGKQDSYIKNIKKKGVSLVDLQNFIEDKNTSPVYDVRTGQYYINVPTTWEKGKPKGDDTQKLYFTTDIKNTDRAQVLTGMESAIINRDSDKEPGPKVVYRSTGDAFVYLPSLNKDKKNIYEPKIVRIPPSKRAEILRDAKTNKEAEEALALYASTQTPVSIATIRDAFDEENKMDLFTRYKTKYTKNEQMYAQ